MWKLLMVPCLVLIRYLQVLRYGHTWTNFIFYFLIYQVGGLVTIYNINESNLTNVNQENNKKNRVLLCNGEHHGLNM
jgi:hypothetical protein